MGLWGKPGEWKHTAPQRAQLAAERKSHFRLDRGSPDEKWIVSFCPKHGFTQAKFTRAVDNSTSVFLGDCGCEILHGGFLVTREDGSIGKIEDTKIIT